ncbi:U-box domain-containing protein 8-like [Phalaenopsis equestris]|uniref:U-box domain-containing protein 8-like n=1 Tax=Phalaenopsis equestris TaxID=78828 RepID=UPI0009E3A3A1|nr:U-box domain-containing protein 8-like [Phalaenopsis equestris]
MDLKYPDDFRCPISLEVMSDPVIVASGHTFDRSSIQRWIDSGHHTCPVTKLPLPPHSPLIPNHALRSLIHSYNPVVGRESSKRKPSRSTDQICFLSSLSYPASATSLSTLLGLAKDEPAFRRVLSDSSAPSILLRHAASPDSPDLQNLALRTLIYLSLDGDDARVGLVADGAIDSLARALASGGPNVSLAATVLTSLAVVEVNKCTIGAHPFAIPALSVLLRNGKGRDRREAATALYELCKFPENRGRAVRAVAVPALVYFAGDGSERAVQVLSLIAKCREGREAMANVEGFVRVLAGVLMEGTGRGIEHALLVLNFVCSDIEKFRWEAKEEGVLEICLVLIQKDYGKIGRNALALATTIEKGEFVGLI